jgi:uncharacterized membrane protein YfcA
MEAGAVVSGFLTGIAVGMTGVGGGAIMTPVLILPLGVAPQTMRPGNCFPGSSNGISNCSATGTEMRRT